MDKLGDKLQRLLDDPDIAEHCRRIRQQCPSEQAVCEQIVATVREAYARHMAQG